ncbi:hypothetical protein [Hamadaea tsunoensis]|uniref:hypothetical protein n=1 Tax=Hamadaea tsunoensis TaxID=53368 RepID=UPI0012F9CB3C|nr:hypothetical protein [Hamadaea tsunoensis]
MANHTLQECERSEEITGRRVVIEDYDGSHATLCRRGLWVGRDILFVQTVALCFEHDPDRLNVFWSLQNDTEILYPVPGTGPTGIVPNTPGIRWIWPYQGLQHRIAFVGVPGATPFAVQAQVLYQEEAGGPIITGPSASVEVSGRRTVWPPDKLAEEERCRQAWYDILSRYVRWKEPRTGEPVMWLDEIHGRDAHEVAALVDQVEAGGDDPELIAAVEQELSARVLRAQVRAARRAR